MVRITFEAGDLAGLKAQFDAFMAGYLTAPAQAVVVNSSEPPAAKRARRTKEQIEADAQQSAPKAEAHTPAGSYRYTIDDVKAAVQKACDKHGAAVYSLVGRILIDQYKAKNLTDFDKDEHVGSYAAFIDAVDALTVKDTL